MRRPAWALRTHEVAACLHADQSSADFKAHRPGLQLCCIFAGKGRITEAVLRSAMVSEWPTSTHMAQVRSPSESVPAASQDGGAGPSPPLQNGHAQSEIGQDRDSIPSFEHVKAVVFASDPALPVVSHQQLSSWRAKFRSHMQEVSRLEQVRGRLLMLLGRPPGNAFPMTCISKGVLKRHWCMFDAVMRVAGWLFWDAGNNSRALKLCHVCRLQRLLGRVKWTGRARLLCF